MTRAVVFDFDGVVLESVEIKTVAFRRLFEHHEDGERIVEFHLAHGGISRFEKFRWFHEVVLGERLDDEEEQRLGRRFSSLVLEELLRCEFVPGALELLRRRCGQLPLFVASGTPQDELRLIVDKRELTPFFEGVYGTPATKAEILRRIAAEHGWDGRELAMIGDATTDLDGARAVEARFVGRVPPGGVNPFAGADVPVVEDLRELDERWEALLA